MKKHASEHAVDPRKKPKQEKEPPHGSGELPDDTDLIKVLWEKKFINMSTAERNLLEVYPVTPNIHIHSTWEGA